MRFNTIMTLLFLIGFSILINSCCDEPLEEYSKVNDIMISAFSDKLTDYPIYDNDSTNTDTLTIKVEFDYSFIVHNSVRFSLIQCAYGLKCPEPGKNGLKNEIKSMIVTSNQKFMNREPNTELNDLITCRYNYYEPDITFNSMQDSLNSWNYYFLEYPFNIFINSKPDNNLTHRFTLDVEFEDGQKVTKETVRIKWE